MRRLRRAKIVATLGPASSNASGIIVSASIVSTGRMNSHGCSWMRNGMCGTYSSVASVVVA